MARFRFRLSCGHTTPVVDDDGADVLRNATLTQCARCLGDARVVDERRLKDGAPLSSFYRPKAANR